MPVDSRRKVGERAKGGRVPSYCRPSRPSVVAPPRPAPSRDPATCPSVFRQPSSACRASHAVSRGVRFRAFHSPAHYFMAWGTESRHAVRANVYPPTTTPPATNRGALHVREARPRARLPRNGSGKRAAPALSVLDRGERGLRVCPTHVCVCDDVMRECGREGEKRER